MGWGGSGHVGEVWGGLCRGGVSGSCRGSNGSCRAGMGGSCRGGWIM